MNIYSYSLPPLITALILTGVGLFVFFKNKKSWLNILFSLFCFSMVVWLFGYTNMYLSKDEFTALKWARFGFLGIVFIPVLGYHFILFFLNRREKILLPIVYLFSIPGLWFSQSDYIYSGIKEHFWGYYPTAGKAQIIFLLIFGMLFIRAVYLLARQLSREQKGNRREQIKYMCIAFGIGTIGIVDYLPKYPNFEVYPFGYICALIFILLMTLAIFRYQLLGINIVIKRALIYSILAALITSIYLIFVMIIEKALHQFIGYTSIIATILAVFTIAISFIPVKNKVQHAIDYLFFKGTIDTLAKEKAIIYKELLRSERLKAVATLSAGMAHEIKNPLTAIKTFTEHLKDHKDDAEFIDKFQRIVGTEVEKINDLVRQLLDFSRPKPLSLKQTNINDLLDDILALLNNDMLRQKISLYKKYGYIPAMMVDPNQLRQAFLNIILNAIEAMPNGGELKVTTYWINGKDSVEIMIQDEGKGMSTEELSHIFDPFRSTKEAGTGLGLSITHEIIKKHNGTITVDSLVGFGTTVKIRFMGVIP